MRAGKENELDLKELKLDKIGFQGWEVKFGNIF